MTLRKKIILSNILTIILPVTVILVLWAGYVIFSGGAGMKSISRSSDRGDRLTGTVNILYAFEAELSDMNWDAVAVAGDEQTDVVLSPEKERVDSLERLGFHIQVESDSGVSYSNMDEADQLVLSGTETEREGTVYWRGTSLVIRDSFHASGRTWYLTAVYNESRAQQGFGTAMLPLYMVSPAMIIIFLLIVTACIVLTSLVTTRWMRKSVLTPLEELKKGADMVAKDDLDYQIPYSGKDEFGDVCAAFDHMRFQLKEAQQKQKRYEEERQDLLRGISHDLRSPLTSIKGYAMGLKDGIADTGEKKQRYCDAILTRAEDLERLTGSLSVLVRLENDSSLFHLERVCLDEYIRQLLTEKEAWLADRRIKVTYRTQTAEAEVNLDIREMQRVFMNLFENTVRYRREDSSRTAILVLPAGNRVEIRYSDDGPGVSRKHLDHLFESFYRTDEARTNPEKGSGIGLAVVKRIVEGQGGQVKAGLDKGLCITMMLPLAEEVQRDEENTDR